jgi:hypothetical protein
MKKYSPHSKEINKETLSEMKTALGKKISAIDKQRGKGM